MRFLWLALLAATVFAQNPDQREHLTAQALANLTAFTRLYGYVRFFHPSDQAAHIDWEAFAIEGIRRVEKAASRDELILALNQLLRPIAPTVQVFATGAKPPSPAFGKALEIVRYRHFGVGLSADAGPNSPYQSVLQRVTAETIQDKLFESEIVPGVTAIVPLALYADSEGTLPHLPQPAYTRDPHVVDRATRLASVVIAWNVFQHFYPYFDVVDADWPAELSKALRTAATDRNADEFEKTLERLIAALKDGLSRVTADEQRTVVRAPITIGWVENQFVLTGVRDAEIYGLAAGDRVLRIDGQPVDDAAANASALFSGATDRWIRWRTSSALSICNSETWRMALDVEPWAAPGTIQSVLLTCTANAPASPEVRPNRVAELDPGVLYLNLERVSQSDWESIAIPKLAKAKAIIIDMRGQPNTSVGAQLLSRLTERTLTSSRFNVASALMPDQRDSTYTERTWEIPADSYHYFSGRRVFLIDERVIGTGETLMSIVEHYRLGEILGSPTAGTNGTLNSFHVPAGYTIRFTGMKTLKHDESRHHGVGIQPTISVERTRKGTAEGKDELLLRAQQLLKQ